MEEFAKKFDFRKSGKLLVGVERECFLADEHGNIVPRAAEILRHFPDRKRFGYELSACQFEDRIGPVKINDVKKALLQNERDIEIIENRLGFKRLHVEVAPETMPLDIYPDPTGRYQDITQNMSRHILLAACRVVGTHVHIGMPDHETALRVYNLVIKHMEALCELGDGSGGERLRIYKIMAPDFQSPPYVSWKEFYEVFVRKEYESDPRKCWNLIRISVHGTIEFRMFGATSDLDKIVEWAEICHQLCQEAMEV
jgi:gamma-glutamyl:cysteine ligase YbdK (ATP-grasp superfamily)